jgi:hypothetical protein
MRARDSSVMYRTTTGLWPVANQPLDKEEEK